MCLHITPLWSVWCDNVVLYRYGGMQGRSAPFEVRGPSIRCILAPPGEDLPQSSFLGAATVTTLSPPRIHVGYQAGLHSTKDWIGVARIGAVPNEGETSRCWYNVPRTPAGILTFESSYLPKKRGEFEFCYVDGASGKVR